MFDPFNSSFEEAVKLSVNVNDPNNPIYQWSDAQEIIKQKVLIDGGDGFAVLACIRKCVTRGLVAPDWLAYAFNSRYDSVLNFRAKSWDDPIAFGSPYKKGTNINARRKKRMSMYAVYNEINRILRENPETPIDSGLFEIVGNKFFIGKTLASEYYYEAKSRLTL
jgi:hypothetical protein